MTDQALQGFIKNNLNRTPKLIQKLYFYCQ